jgi:hypothetical protein
MKGPHKDPCTPPVPPQSVYSNVSRDKRGHLLSDDVEHYYFYGYIPPLFRRYQSRISENG